MSMIGSEPLAGRELHRRVQGLGLTLLELGEDGSAWVEHVGDELERVVCESALFKAWVRVHWADLCAEPCAVVTLHRGVRVAALGPARGTGEAGRLAVEAVLLPGEGFEQVIERVGGDGQAWDRGRQMSAAHAEQTARMLGWMQSDAERLRARDGEVADLSGQLGRTYEELSFVYRFSSGVAVNRSPETFLSDACGELAQVIDMRWAGLQLVDDSRALGPLGGKALLSVAEGSEERLGDAEAFAPLGRALMEQAGGRQQAWVIDDVRELGLAGLEGWASSLLVVPVRTDGELLGVLLAADKNDGGEISSAEAQLCTSLADSLSVFLHNTKLYTEMEEMFLGSLHALVSAIDAKDSYTHGHSRRVALLGRQLAEQAGFEQRVCQRVYLSGLVHDVGKIGVPEAVLCKPGKLTDEEFDQIKRHPEIGAHILSDIQAMRDLIPGVLHHHERWDGRGYPHGLAGQEIPLFGRLLGLADAFDAMSSSRTYRKAMSLEKVLEEIRRCRGAQFDPELTDVFLEMDFSAYQTELLNTAA